MVLAFNMVELNLYQFIYFGLSISLQISVQ